tara:strand:- start:13 stop:279 length:267 start_codon:yes stop_codon:yes gene_type:complete
VPTQRLLPAEARAFTVLIKKPTKRMVKKRYDPLLPKRKPSPNPSHLPGLFAPKRKPSPSPSHLPGLFAPGRPLQNSARRLPKLIKNRR